MAPYEEIKMDSRDLWEDQVDRLTKQCREFSLALQDMESRMEYFENVILTLLMSLKKSGVIQLDPEGENSFE
jgi:hypothetical protein